MTKIDVQKTLQTIVQKIFSIDHDDGVITEIKEDLIRYFFTPEELNLIVYDDDLVSDVWKNDKFDTHVKIFNQLLSDGLPASKIILNLDQYLIDNRQELEVNILVYFYFRASIVVESLKTELFQLDQIFDQGPGRAFQVCFALYTFPEILESSIDIFPYERILEDEIRKNWDEIIVQKKRIKDQKRSSKNKLIWTGSLIDLIELFVLLNCVELIDESMSNWSSSWIKICENFRLKAPNISGFKEVTLSDVKKELSNLKEALLERNFKSKWRYKNQTVFNYKELILEKGDEGIKGLESDYEFDFRINKELEEQLSDFSDLVKQIETIDSFLEETQGLNHSELENIFRFRSTIVIRILVTDLCHIEALFENEAHKAINVCTEIFDLKPEVSSKHGPVSFESIFVPTIFQMWKYIQKYAEEFRLKIKIDKTKFAWRSTDLLLAELVVLLIQYDLLVDKLKGSNQVHWQKISEHFERRLEKGYDSIKPRSLSKAYREEIRVPLVNDQFQPQWFYNEKSLIDNKKSILKGFKSEKDEFVDENFTM